jgi:hypothetical protein
MKKPLNLAIAVIVVLTVLCAAWLQPWSQPQTAVATLYSGTKIATVANEPIYLSQAAFRAQGVATAHDLESGLTDKPAAQTPWADLILQSLGDIIIRREAAKAGLHVPQKDIWDYMNTLVNGSGGSVNFEAFLERSGLTLPQLEMRVYMNLLGAALYLDVTKKVTISEQEVRANFEENRSQYTEKNDDIAYLGAHDAIKQQLLKERKDAVWQKWLKQQEASPEYEINVTEENWWNQLPDPTPTSPASPATPAPTNG